MYSYCDQFLGIGMHPENKMMSIVHYVLYCAIQKFFCLLKPSVIKHGGTILVKLINLLGHGNFHH